jgi:hypothetical protein
MGVCEIRAGLIFHCIPSADWNAMIKGIRVEREWPSEMGLDKNRIEFRPLDMRSVKQGFTDKRPSERGCSRGEAHEFMKRLSQI